MRKSLLFPLFLFFLLSFCSAGFPAEPQISSGDQNADMLSGTLKAAGSIVSSVFDLGNIFIGGKRLASPFQEFVSSSVSSSHIVAKRDIERSGARSLPEALADAPGVTASDLAGNGEETTLDVRGFNEGRDFVFNLDGVRLNEPKSNNINFPLIPLGLAERIEISRGGASFLYGEGAMGGVANIVSAAPEALGTQGRIRTLAGSFGEWGESFELGHRRDSGLGLFMSGDIYHTDGFRQNSSVEKQHFYGKSIWDPSDKLRAALSYLYAKARLDRSGSIRESLIESLGPEATERPRNFADLDTNLVIANFNLELWESAALSGNGFVRRSNELSVANFATFDTNDNELLLESDTWGTTVQLDHSRPLFCGLAENFLIGFDYVENSIDEEDYSRSKATLGRISRTVDSDSSKDAYGIFSKASLSWNERIGAYFGVRYDHISFRNLDLINAGNNVPRDLSSLSYSAGASADIVRDLAVSAIYSRSFRAPNLSDLYANPLFGGNPALQPEESSDYEIGLKWHPESLTVKTAAFLNNRVNEIGFDPNLVDSTFLFGRNNNFGKTQRMGLESSVEARPAAWLRLRGAHTYTEALYKSNTASGTQISGDHIPMIPRNRYTAGILVEPAHDLRLDLNMTAVSKQVLTNDITNDQNGRRLPSYLIFNFKTAYIYKDWEFSFEVRNLFDERYASAGSLGAAPSSFNADKTVENNFFVPAPGRSCSGTVSYTW